MSATGGRVFLRARTAATWVVVLAVAVIGGLTATASEARAELAADGISPTPTTDLKTCEDRWDDYWVCIAEHGPLDSRCVVPNCDVVVGGPVLGP